MYVCMYVCMCVCVSVCVYVCVYVCMYVLQMYMQNDITTVNNKKIVTWILKDSEWQMSS